MVKLKNPPKDYFSVEDIVDEFGITKATLWNYVKWGLIKGILKRRARPSENIRKVREGYVSPEDRFKLKCIMALKQQGLGINTIKRVITNNWSFKVLRDAMEPRHLVHLPYKPNIFLFDSQERLNRFYKEYKEKHNQEWTNDYEIIRKNLESLQHEVEELTGRLELLKHQAMVKRNMLTEEKSSLDEFGKTSSIEIEIHKLRSEEVKLESSGDQKRLVLIRKQIYELEEKRDEPMYRADKIDSEIRQIEQELTFRSEEIQRIIDGKETDINSVKEDWYDKNLNLYCEVVPDKLQDKLYALSSSKYLNIEQAVKTILKELID